MTQHQVKGRESDMEGHVNTVKRRGSTCAFRWNYFTRINPTLICPVEIEAACDLLLILSQQVASS
jgi:hypothetical protein